MAMRRLRGVPCSNDTTAFPLSGPWPGTCGYMLHLMDSGVAEFVRKLVWNHSLLDIGAGTGMYGAHFHSLRADPSRGSRKVDAPAWMGFDGSPDVENYTRTNGPPGSLTLQADLCEPSLTLPTLDWAMSLEVGEHLPTHCLANYLRLLDAGNRRGLFLSWAVPGQSGHCHINTRAPAVVVATLAVLGYEYAVNDTLRARSEANTNWFKNTLMVFRRVARPSCASHKRLLSRAADCLLANATDVDWKACTACAQPQGHNEQGKMLTGKPVRFNPNSISSEAARELAVARRRKQGKML